MKILLIAVFSTLILSLLFQSFILMPKNKTEEQPYTVVLKDNAFEIRLYPEATMATIYADVHKYQDLSGPGFRKLAGYIFGGNESKQQITTIGNFRFLGYDPPYKFLGRRNEIIVSIEWN